MAEDKPVDNNISRFPTERVTSSSVRGLPAVIDRFESYKLSRTLREKPVQTTEVVSHVRINSPEDLFDEEKIIMLWPHDMPLSKLRDKLYKKSVDYKSACGLMGIYQKMVFYAQEAYINKHIQDKDEKIQYFEKLAIYTWLKAEEIDDQDLQRKVREFMERTIPQDAAQRVQKVVGFLPKASVSKLDKPGEKDTAVPEHPPGRKLTRGDLKVIK